MGPETVLFFGTFGLCFLFFYFAEKMKENSEILFLTFFQMGIIFIYLTLHSVFLIVANSADAVYRNFAVNLDTGALIIIPSLNVLFWIFYYLQFAKRTAEEVGLIKKR